MMNLRESLILPPRLLLYDGVVQPTATGNIDWQRFPDNETLRIPDDLTTAYEQRLARIESELASYQRKLDQCAKTTPENILRETIKHLFPCASIAVKNKKEGILFHERRMEQYLDHAFQEGKGFRHWLYADHLPDTLHQMLGLPEELKMVQSFTDAVKYLATGINDDRLSASARSDVFQHDLWGLSQLTYLYGLVDLATDVEDEKLLDEFVTQEASTFLGFEDQMSLSVQLDEQGNPLARRMSWVKRDDAVMTAFAESRTRTAIVPLTVRRISTNPNDQVVMEHRGKERYSEAFKILLGREVPVKDKSGARFILMDFTQYHSFMLKLQKDFPDWIFEEDKDKPSEESALEYAVKYFAYKKGNPRHKVEIQIDWLTNKGLFQGSYIPKMFQRGKTHHEYRMKQLLKIFPRVFPKRLYRIDWESPDVKKSLLQYAYSKATGVPQEYFAPYELE